MHALGREHVGTDQVVERLQQHGAAADLVGERRQAQFDALARIALGLPVERLMLAVLLEQDHRQQARPGKAARQDVERRRRLRDLLAVPAGELLPHVLHDLHCRGITSSVSVTSSPSLASLLEPQQAQALGPGTTTRSRGRCAGNGWRDGLRRVKARTVVDTAACSAATRPRRRRLRVLRAAAPSDRAAAPGARCAGRTSPAAASRW